LSLALSHTTHIVVIGLIVVVHVAVVEVHVPGVTGIVNVGSSRPVIAGVSVYPLECPFGPLKPDPS